MLLLNIDIQAATMSASLLLTIGLSLNMVEIPNRAICSVIQQEK
jgi:hypothetical protein